MSNIVKRGEAPNDKKEFGGESLGKLQKAAQDLKYLLEQDYQIKGASTFVGNHYLLSERQRLALVRAISPEESLRTRGEKEITVLSEGSEVHIDGFNTIITLEVAASGTLLLKCMDGTVRDLAALRGTYRLIDKTDIAILQMGQILERNKVGTAVFYLDAPVSNSGRLKQRILELLEPYSFEVQVEVINNVDSVLEKLDKVVSSDAIILNKCISWFNLNAQVMEEFYDDYPYIDFSQIGHHNIIE